MLFTKHFNLNQKQLRAAGNKRVVLVSGKFLRSLNKNFVHLNERGQNNQTPRV
jgi:hypothetical protein